MYQLPKEVLDQVNEMLLNENMKYSDIQHWLENEYGVKISLSSISNYAVKIYRAAQRVSDDLERTKFFLDYIGDQREIDATKASTTILLSGLLQKISTAEEEFNEMPIEKAGRLLVELTKAGIARDRLDFDRKKKMNIALEAFESDLMDEVKKYPEIREKFKAAFSELKKKLDAEKENKHE